MSRLPMILVALCLLSTWPCGGQISRRRLRNRGNTPRRNDPSSGLPTHLQQAYYSAVNEDDGSNQPPASTTVRSTTTTSPTTTTTITVAPTRADRPGNFPDDDDAASTNRQNNLRWGTLAPTPPSPENVDCIVEVQETRWEGGKCTLLSGRSQRYVCQSGPYIAFSPVCNQRVYALRRLREEEARLSQETAQDVADGQEIGGQELPASITGSDFQGQITELAPDITPASSDSLSQRR
ncbi:hypothetical protein MAR_029758 [Mya arenaria]|uniref:Uncharacterized protein n=1 Tax=Mya arenaria TaxID=6604 RepID=A0ABY7DIM0_MYAAR|nr:uncharacterized protein LOC128219297 [Mya arenaria]WAQ97068.1 hypothetical protein MAR_029758 [Mya arenaria]